MSDVKIKRGHRKLRTGATPKPGDILWSEDGCWLRLKESHELFPVEPGEVITRKVERAAKKK